MKKLITIPKRSIEPPIDFGAVIDARRALDVDLTYEEYGFMQLNSGRAVLFDPYSAAHRYGAFDVELGAVAFPFCLTCMTDNGERVAYCGLRLGEEPITSWNIVFGGKRSEIMSRLAVDHDAAAIALTSGVCCIADVEAYADFITHMNDEIHPLSGLIVLNGQTHTAVDIFGKRFAVFSTGWGDGRFKCYVGRAADGRPMRLIVDFGMIEYPAEHGDMQVEIDAEDAYIYDPQMSETDNNIARWTVALRAAQTPTDRLIAYSRRGYTYHSAGKIAEALADYEAAARECDSVKDRGALLRAWPVFDNAARLYAEHSDYDSAIKLMNKALGIHDHFYAGAFLRLIDLYSVTKNTEKAEEIADRMIKERPDDPVANMKYAEVSVANLDYEKAAVAYKKLVNDFKLYDNVFDAASCLIELERYDEADAMLESYPAKEDSEQYWYYKAYIDSKNMRYTAALEKARRAHRLDAEYMPAIYLLIDIQTLLQEYLSVASYAEEYKRMRPNAEYGYSVCAEAHLALGNFSESSKNYYHLYETVKPQDESYGALAAITAARIGDGKRKSAIIRDLKRRRSPYYYGIVYAMYIKKVKDHDEALSKLVCKVGDDDFLLQLAVYLDRIGEVIPATRLLKLIVRANRDPAAEVVAMQVRTASRMNDNKLFGSLFDYYIEHYLGANISPIEREALKIRFTAPIQRQT